MPNVSRTCLCHGCAEPVSHFQGFPNVRGYCLGHGTILVEFLVELWPASYYSAARRLGLNVH